MASRRERRSTRRVRGKAFGHGLVWGAAIVAWAQAIQDEDTRRTIVRELCSAGVHSYGHGEHCAYCGGRYEDLEVA